MKKYAVHWRTKSYETDSSEAARRTFYAVAAFWQEGDPPLVYFARNSAGQKVVLDSRGISTEDLKKYE